MSTSGQEMARASSSLPGEAWLGRAGAAVGGRSSLVRAALLSALLVVTLRIVLAVVLAISCGDGHCDTQGITWYGPAPMTSGWQGLLVGPWQRNDAVYYATIALHGYQAPSAANGPVGAFFPLFPLLIRALLPVAGGDAILSGLLVNTLLAVIGLTLLFRLVETDFGVRAGYRAQLLMGAGPAMFFVLSPLSEATFFTFTVAAVLAMRRGRVGLAALLAVAATLSRLQGILVMVPLVIEVTLQARARHGAGGRALRWSQAALVLPPLALLGFQWYVTGHGYPGGLLTTEQVFWHSHLVVPGVAMWDSLQWVVSHGDVPELVNLLAVGGLLLSLPFMWRRLRPSDTAYAAVSLLAIVSHVNGFSPLMSALRFSLLAYPVWMLLGRSLPSPRALRRGVVVLVALTVLVAVAVSGYHMIQ